MTANFRWFGLVATILTVAFSTACETEYAVGLTGSDMDRVDTLQSGGLTRTFAAHLPDDYEAGSSPVVIVLHGIRAIGQSLQYISAFDIDADQWGFLVAYPDATSDWATGCNCTAADSAGVDDVQFIADLLDKLDADYGINRDSVFVVGYSEGAFMAQKLVCDATDSFVGMATVSATMLASAADNCAPTREIPVLMIHGTDDNDYPWDGALDRGLASSLAADTAAQFWATSNGCGDRLESEFVRSDTRYSFDVYRDAFDACPTDGEVILYRMEGAGHGWPDADFSASFEITGFFAGADTTVSPTQ